ncbi:hypothetical protein BU15DRAFT_71158 [Melanogaster broomeanus]|nr:hypothetical protein BU15DRAFT_71158 [Melanogaster broomeanus]
MFDPGDAAIAAGAISSLPRTPQDGTGTTGMDRGFAAISKQLDIHGICQWGRTTTFKPEIKGENIKSHTLRFVAQVLILDSEKKVTPLRLEGRGTYVMGVICDRLKREKSAHETEGGMAAKKYCAEEARVSKEVAAQDDVVRGHALDMLSSKQFAVSTSSIRKALGFNDPAEGSCSLFLISKNRSPIKELQNYELWDAWRHYVLWKAGIHHRDISCESLVYYRFDGKVIGVLNDYDLASLTSSKNPLSYERTGAILFTAIDLLDANARDSKVEHLYRHVMESFIWVFVWICFQYKDRKLRVPGPLDAWAKTDASGCTTKKASFLLRGQVPRDVHNRKYVVALVCFLRTETYSRSSTRLALDRAESQLDRDLPDATLDASQVAELKEKIKQLKMDLIEQSDDAVFREFAGEIGFDTTNIDAVVSRVRGL